MTDQTDPVAAATSLVSRFFRCLDMRDYDEMAQILDGGVWHRRGIKIDSRETLLEVMAERSPTMRIAHLLTNQIGQLRSDGSVEVTAYMLVVRHDSGTAPDGPSPLTGIESIRTTRAIAAPSPEGWRLKEVAGEPAEFEAGA